MRLAVKPRKINILESINFREAWKSRLIISVFRTFRIYDLTEKCFIEEYNAFYVVNLHDD